MSANHALLGETAVVFISSAVSKMARWRLCNEIVVGATKAWLAVGKEAQGAADAETRSGQHPGASACRWSGRRRRRRAAGASAKLRPRESGRYWSGPAL